MSRARKIKKWNRIFEWVDPNGVHVSVFGYLTERDARLDRMHSKRMMTTRWGWLKPAPVKRRR